MSSLLEESVSGGGGFFARVALVFGVAFTFGGGGSALAFGGRPRRFGSGAVGTSGIVCRGGEVRAHALLRRWAQGLHSLPLLALLALGAQQCLLPSQVPLF